MTESADRQVLVTGAGSGIGLQVARRFADTGARVVIAEVNPESGEAAAAAIPGAEFVRLDVTDPNAVRAAVNGLGRPIDVLVNNAVVCLDDPFDDLSIDAWNRQIAGTITGPFLMTQAVLPGMIAARSGSIVNISSVNAVTYLGNEAYSAGKAALLSLTRSVAVRYGPFGIRCNAVIPGTIRTSTWDKRLAIEPDLLTTAARWYPLGRIGDPDDVASAVLFLAGPQASWITGAALPVDGGLLAGNQAMTDDIVPSADIVPMAIKTSS